MTPTPLKAIKLYSYFRSSAAFRVRIALNLKGLPYDCIPVNLRTDGQNSVDYKGVNPAGLVPALETDEGSLGQSLAIIEWLEEVYPQTALLPGDPWEKAQARAMAYNVACDIHPLNNLRVLKYLRENFSAGEDDVEQWYHHWIAKGFTALEQQIKAAPYCLGDTPSLVDICLIPQVNNAYRFNMNLDEFPKIQKVFQHCMAQEAFQKAAPEQQPDAC